MDKPIVNTSLFDFASIQIQALKWFHNDFLLADYGLQVGLLLAAVLLAMTLAPRLEIWAGGLEE
ncbi:MAG: hypothetical protein ACI8W1_001224 [Candidatus Azotimanducaceae bacterium]|jgi:hypothetical protein